MFRIHNFNQYLTEHNAELAPYTELEFVCHNSDSATSSDMVAQKKFYEALKTLQKETDYAILPYMQDFSEGDHKELSLAVIILDRLNEEMLSQAIMRMAKEHGIDFDLYNKRTENQVDGIVRGDLYHNMI